MILLLFSILCGFLLCLFLCSPFELYPIIATIFIAAIALIIVSHSMIKYKKKLLYILLIIPFTASYILCSFLIFYPVDNQLAFHSDSSKLKKAVIFYCSGQMDQYSPNEASKLATSGNLIHKPFELLRLKMLYKKVLPLLKADGITVGASVNSVAKDLRNSLLLNYPYYFYLSYSKLAPNIYTALQSAINEGCSEITIVNYCSEKLVIPDVMLKQLKTHHLTLRITQLVSSSPSFPQAVVYTAIAKVKPEDGLLIFGSDNASFEKISALLTESGYDKNKIFTASLDSADSTIQKCKTLQLKSVFCLNLSCDNLDYKNYYFMKQLQAKYASSIKIDFLSDWDYNKYLVKSSIEAIRNKH